MAPEKQENVSKKLPVIMQSISYKHTRLYFLEILHTLTKKEAKLASIESWKAFIRKGMHKIPPHEYFTAQERLIWKVMASLLPKAWITLPGPAKWWEKYPENAFQKHWDIPSGKRFEECVQLMYTLFTYPDAPKNAERIVEEIQALQNICG